MRGPDLKSGGEDRKTREVIVAQYGYRHEAEFAAGFLDEAGIPYRLQIDDPAMGLTVASPATLWVRGIDLRRAQETLDIKVKPARREPPTPRLAEAPVQTRAESRGTPSGGMARGGSRRPGRSPKTLTGVPSGTGMMPGLQLGYRERGLALAASIGGAASAPLVRDGGPDVFVVTLVVIAAGLFLVAAVGRAPGFLHRLLRALSGSAP